MKANELMIGDWVLIDSIPKRLNAWDILEISRGNEDVEPIYLTEEILKANGLRVGYNTSAGEEVLLRIDWYNDYIHPVLWKVHIVYNEMDIFRHRVIDTRINFVHELQHALRLCDLNELADDFKVTNSNSADLGDEEIKEE